MDPAVQQFIDKQAEKSAAKAEALEAVGSAKLAELHGLNASDFWAVVEEKGIGGTEGRLQAELQAMADAYVEDNPQYFASIEELVPDGHEQLVQSISIFREAGMVEQATRLTMFELARFERQEIGVAVRARARIGGKG